MSIISLSHGLHLDIPEDAYHAPDIQLASKHGLDLILDCPARFKAAFDFGRKEPTEDQYLGTAFHCAALQPDVYLRTYTVMPDFGPTRANEELGITPEVGKANKWRRKAWLAENEGKTLLEADQAKTIEGMVAALRADELAGPLLERSLSEVTCRWRDPRTGVECKARADLWCEELALLDDLKSSFDASWTGFRFASEKYGYYKQDSMYRRGWAATGHTIGVFMFTFIEKDPPYLVAHYEHDPDDIAAGIEANEIALEDLATCLATGEWPGYGIRADGRKEIRRVPLRRWAHERIGRRR